MSATTPGNPNGTAADPSMEDILASIRRILSEDEGAPLADTAPAPEPAPSPSTPAAELHAVDGQDDGDVFSLDSSMLVEEPPPPPRAPAPPAPPPVPAAPVHAATADHPPAASSSADGLLGAAAAAAASSSLGTLVRTLAERQSVAVYRGGPTLEDLVRDEMRPLLKAWLDEHLPPLVERLVRAEIERVVGRAVS